MLSFSDAKESSESSEITQEQLLENFHLMAPSEEDMPVLWNAVSNYKTMRSGYALDSDSDKLKVRASPGPEGVGVNAFLPEAC